MITLRTAYSFFTAFIAVRTLTLSTEYETSFSSCCTVLVQDSYLNVSRSRTPRFARSPRSSLLHQGLRVRLGGKLALPDQLLWSVTAGHVYLYEADFVVLCEILVL
jgi:hypothetical protein